MTAIMKRNLIRILHLIGAVIIGAYVYSPWKELEWFALLNQVVVVPALTLSGLWMWKGHLLRKMFRSDKS